MFCIFFLKISRVHKTHLFPISVSPDPFNLLTCDFQVIFGNLKRVRDHRCQDLRDCYSFVRFWFFFLFFFFLKTTKAIKNNLFSSYSILFQKKIRALCGCMVFKISRLSWFKTIFVLRFYSKQHLDFSSWELQAYSCYQLPLRTRFTFSVMSVILLDTTNHLTARGWQQ